MTKRFSTYGLVLMLLSAYLPVHGQIRDQRCFSTRPRLEPTACEMRMKEELDQEDTLRICILGDMMLHTAQLHQALQAGADSQDSESYRFDSFRLIEDRLKAADLTIANLEFTLAGPPYSGYPSFSAPDSYAQYAADCGVDVFLTANNHILDKGSRGTARTLEVYRKMEASAGIRWTGCSPEGSTPYAPLLIDIKGTRIALLNFTYGTNVGKDRHWPEINYLRQKIVDEAFHQAKEGGAKVCIALPHWGPEYQLRHSASQKQAALMLSDAGADIIIGAHPHVIQDKEILHKGKENVQVLYSLGNAVSNMSAPDTQAGLLAHLTMIVKMNGTVDILPVQTTWLWCSRPGGYDRSYTVLPIADYIGRRSEWMGPWDYDKMMKTWKRVSTATGIAVDATPEKNKTKYDKNDYIGSH